MKRKMDYFINKEIKWGSWVVCLIYFVSWMVYFSIQNVNQVYYDGMYYWTVAEPVFIDGINILNFPETCRGYIWPTIIQLIKLFGDKFWGSGFISYRLFTAICLALFFSQILPCLFEKKITKVIDIIRMILLLAILMILWGPFWFWPLSDFAALFFMVTGIVFIKIAMQKEKVSRFIMAILSGIMLYAAYNTRVAYIYALWVILIIAIIKIIMGMCKREKISWILIVGIMIGLAILAFPQSLINHQYINSYSPRVVTEQYSNYERSLQKQQVLWGLTYSNYETYVGPENEYPCPNVNFMDEVGVEIVRREGLSAENFGYMDIFKLFMKYPMDMISIYTRHFISLMTPKFLNTYISNIYPAKGMVTILVISIWFLTILNLLIKLQTRKINWKLLSIISIIFIPSLLQLFGAPEIRFFIAIHMIGYFYTLYSFDYMESVALYKKYLYPIVVSFVLFCILWTTVLSSVLNSNQEKTLLINDYNPFVENEIRE